MCTAGGVPILNGKQGGTASGIKEMNQGGDRVRVQRADKSFFFVAEEALGELRPKANQFLRRNQHLQLCRRGHTCQWPDCPCAHVQDPSTGENISTSLASSSREGRDSIGRDPECTRVKVQRADKSFFVVAEEALGELRPKAKQFLRRNQHLQLCRRGHTCQWPDCPCAHVQDPSPQVQAAEDSSAKSHGADSSSRADAEVSVGHNFADSGQRSPGLSERPFSDDLSHELQKGRKAEEADRHSNRYDSHGSLAREREEADREQPGKKFPFECYCGVRVNSRAQLEEHQKGQKCDRIKVKRRDGTMSFVPKATVGELCSRAEYYLKKNYHLLQCRYDRCRMRECPFVHLPDDSFCGEAAAHGGNLEDDEEECGTGAGFECYCGEHSNSRLELEAHQKSPECARVKVVRREDGTTFYVSKKQLGKLRPQAEYYLKRNNKLLQCRYNNTCRLPECPFVHLPDDSPGGVHGNSMAVDDEEGGETIECYCGKRVNSRWELEEHQKGPECTRIKVVRRKDGTSFFVTKELLGKLRPEAEYYLKRTNYLYQCKYENCRMPNCAFVHLPDDCSGEPAAARDDDGDEHGKRFGFECYCGQRVGSRWELEEHQKSPECARVKVVRREDGTTFYISKKQMGKLRPEAEYYLKRNNHLLQCRYNTTCRSADCAFVHLEEDEAAEPAACDARDAEDEAEGGGGFYECYCGVRMNSRHQLEEHQKKAKCDKVKVRRKDGSVLMVTMKTLGDLRPEAEYFLRKQSHLVECKYDSCRSRECPFVHLSDDMTTGHGFFECYCGEKLRTRAQFDEHQKGDTCAKIKIQRKDGKMFYVPKEDLGVMRRKVLEDLKKKNYLEKYYLLPCTKECQSAVCPFVHRKAVANDGPGVIHTDPEGKEAAGDARHRGAGFECRCGESSGSRLQLEEHQKTCAKFRSHAKNGKALGTVTKEAPAVTRPQRIEPQQPAARRNDSTGTSRTADERKEPPSEAKHGKVEVECYCGARINQLQLLEHQKGRKCNRVRVKRRDGSLTFASRESLGNMNQRALAVLKEQNHLEECAAVDCQRTGCPCAHDLPTPVPEEEAEVQQTIDDPDDPWSSAGRWAPPVEYNTDMASGIKPGKTVFSRADWISRPSDFERHQEMCDDEDLLMPPLQELPEDPINSGDGHPDLPYFPHGANPFAFGADSAEGRGLVDASWAAPGNHAFAFGLETNPHTVGPVNESFPDDDAWQWLYEKDGAWKPFEPEDSAIIDRRVCLRDGDTKGPLCFDTTQMSYSGGQLCSFELQMKGDKGDVWHGTEDNLFNGNRRIRRVPTVLE
eukprot:Hpha_TRINITY_DN15689_c6_g3::TRINITY_DN15689_c6_g3_i1::g.100647::m.100647